jgi:hypothetical protein
LPYFSGNIPETTVPPTRQHGGSAGPVFAARYSEAIMNSRRVRIQLRIALGALLVVVLPTSGDAQDINRTLTKLNVEIVGIAVDMLDGQTLGQSKTGAEYRWDVELTPGDRVTPDELLAIEHFQWAGLPMVPGTEVSFTDGIFGPARFRLGGQLTSLDIQSRTRYEIRARVHWSIYDTETSQVIVHEETKGLAKGAVLGLRGEQPNALMDSVIDSLEEFLDKDGEKAIKAARG